MKVVFHADSITVLSVVASSHYYQRHQTGTHSQRTENEERVSNNKDDDKPWLVVTWYLENKMRKQFIKL